jgi:hypothetical protein
MSKHPCKKHKFNLPGEVVGSSRSQGHEDTVRYLTYGCAFRLVDDVDKKFQTYHPPPDTYPTIWVSTRKCMPSYDISEKNTTSRDEDLKNAHKLEKKMEHGKKAAVETPGGVTQTGSAG